MAYTVLYRKKRPRTFSEMWGQPHIVEALRNQLRAGQTSHAYLFCGTRGTGKTTSAKIMARAINCTNLQDGDPCNTCPPCQSILADRCMDVSEIDAASNNSVDDVRELREAVKYPPTECTHKVYIIDEVHMLSGSAFNAFLKTLEEPPPHVVFILATTDPQKVPVTVLSRCQRYDFRRIKTPDIVAALAKYMDEESVAFEPEALDFIAYHCDGAMRDALSLLDQAMSLRTSENAVLTLAAVRDLLGAVDRGVLFALTDALAARDSRAVMQLIDAAAADGRDMGQLASDLVRHFRDALVASLVNDTDGLDVSADTAAQLKAQGQRIAANDLMKYIREFSDVQREMRFAGHKRTALEVCALSVCEPAQTAPTGENPPPLPAPAPPVYTPVSASPAPAKPAVPTPTVSAAPATPSAPIEYDAPSAPAQNNVTDPLTAIPADWQTICRGFAPPLSVFLANCRVEVQGDRLRIVSDLKAERKLIEAKEAIIRAALADRYNLDTPPLLLFAVSGAIRAKTPPPQSTPPPTSAPPTSAHPNVEAPQLSLDIDWEDITEPASDADAPW